MVRELLAKGMVLNDRIHLVAPGIHTITEFERRLREAASLKIRAPSRFPTFHLFRALTPLFRLRKHRMASVIPLLVHFGRYGYISSSPVPCPGEFGTITLESLLKQLSPLRS